MGRRCCCPALVHLSAPARARALGESQKRLVLDKEPCLRGLVGLALGGLHSRRDRDPRGHGRRTHGMGDEDEHASGDEGGT